MKKVFHKLRDYVLALLTLMAMSACSESLNTLGNSHFTKEGELIKKPSFAKLDYNSVIHFYIESSGNSSLKFEIMAKQLYVASQRVL